MAEQEAIPETDWTAHDLAFAIDVARKADQTADIEPIIASALLAAEKRGADRQKEADARIAEERAADLEEQAPFEDTEEWSRLMLVYAKHVRKVARYIRRGYYLEASAIRSQ